MDGKILWKKLEIPVVLKGSNYEKEALSREIRYCRLKRKEIRGKQRYFADIILKGACPVRKAIPIAHPGSVGVAVTLKHLYLVSQSEIRVEEFAKYSEELNMRRGELIRKMEISRRINNPQNYEENGRIRSGSLKWFYSKNYQKNRKRLREIARKQQALRREARGKQIRSILEMGDTFVVELLDYRKLKENYFGKTVESFAAAGFLREMEWKCQVHGRKWIAVETGKIHKLWNEHMEENTIWKTEEASCLQRAFFLGHMDKEGVNWERYQDDLEKFLIQKEQWEKGDGAV